MGIIGRIGEGRDAEGTMGIVGVTGGGTVRRIMGIVGVTGADDNAK